MSEQEKTLEDYLFDNPNYEENLLKIIESLKKCDCQLCENELKKKIEKYKRLFG